MQLTVMVLILLMQQHLCTKLLSADKVNITSDEGASLASSTSKLITDTNSDFNESITRVPFPDFLSDEIQKAMDDNPQLFEGTNGWEKSLPDEPDKLNEVEMRQLCAKVADLVKNYCIPGSTGEVFVPRCKKYFEDCGQYISATDPLYAIANSFTTGVGLNFGTIGIDGISFYPINKDGAIEIGSRGNIPFGSWGGGYEGSFGVRDFWSQFAEFGGNWYEGKYGAKSGWSVPLVQSLGVEGNAGVGVSVPIKKGDLGKPVAVDIGGGLGPYYQQNNHIGIDWMNGGVQQNFGLGIPLLGFGVNSGWGFNFPSASALLTNISKKRSK